MKAINLFFALSLLLLLCPVVRLQYAKGEKKERRIEESTGTMPGKIYMKEKMDRIDDIRHSLQDLKEMSSIVERKTRFNKGLIIGTALANFVVLLMMSGLLGYNTKGIFNARDRRERRDAFLDKFKDTPAYEKAS